jgi:hypothetical protein
MTYARRALYRTHDLIQTYMERMEYSDSRWYEFTHNNRLAVSIFLSDTLDLTIYKNRHMPGASQPCLSGMAWLFQHYYSVASTLEAHAEYGKCTVNIGLTASILAILNRHCKLYSVAPRIIQKTMRYMRCFDRIVATTYLPTMDHNDKFAFSQIGYNVGAVWKCFRLEQTSNFREGYSIPMENYILETI